MIVSKSPGHRLDELRVFFVQGVEQMAQVEHAVRYPGLGVHVVPVGGNHLSHSLWAGAEQIGDRTERVWLRRADPANARPAAPGAVFYKPLPPRVGAGIVALDLHPEIP